MIIFWKTIEIHFETLKIMYPVNHNELWKIYVRWVCDNEIKFVNMFKTWFFSVSSTLLQETITIFFLNVQGYHVIRYSMKIRYSSLKENEKF